MHIYPEPVTLIGSRVFADVICQDEVTLLWRGPNPTSLLEGRDADSTRGESDPRRKLGRGPDLVQLSDPPRGGPSLPLPSLLLQQRGRLDKGFGDALLSPC